MKKIIYILFVVILFAMVIWGCSGKNKKEDTNSKPTVKPVPTSVARYIRDENCIVVKGEKFYLEDAKTLALANDQESNDESGSVNDSTNKKYSIVYFELQPERKRDCWLMNNETKIKTKIKLYKQGSHGGFEKWCGDEVFVMDWEGQGYQNSVYYSVENPERHINVNNSFFYDCERQILIYGDDKHQGLTDDGKVVQKIIIQKGLFNIEKTKSFKVFVPNSKDYIFQAFQVKNIHQKDDVVTINFLTGNTICIDLEKMEQVKCAIDVTTKQE